MKRTLGGLAVAGLMIMSIVGCSAPALPGGQSPQPTVTVTATPEPEPPKVELAPEEPATPTNIEPVPTKPQLSRVQAENLFLQLIRNEFPQYVDTDRDLLAIGYKTCQLLDAGYTLAQTLNNIDPNGGTYRMYIAGSAIGVFCPEYAPEVK